MKNLVLKKLQPQELKKIPSNCFVLQKNIGFLGGSDGKEFACNAGDTGSVSGLGRSPGEVNGNALQCSCLENAMDRGAR